MNRAERRKRERENKKSNKALTKSFSNIMSDEKAEQFTKDFNQKLSTQQIDARANEILVELTQHWLTAMVDNGLTEKKIDKILDDYNTSVNEKYDKKYGKVVRTTERVTGIKDYLNADETNEFLISRYMYESVIKKILKDWGDRKNLTKDEAKYLKFAKTYLTKFDNAVAGRLGNKEVDKFNKRLEDFQFVIMDSITKRRLEGNWSKELEVVKLPREEFEDLCEQLMVIHCKDCKKKCNDCKMHELFYNNFVEESTWRLPNCRYAYNDDTTIKQKKKPKKKSKRKKKQNREDEE